MKTTDTYTGHRTFDLTECKVNAMLQPDGSTHIVARWPKTYTKGERMTGLPVAKGGTVDMCPYDVTEWNETVLQVIPPAA